jgi:tetratricopeptide (TPR) repeat protein/DNA-binding XRE family transcriptional regulator
MPRRPSSHVDDPIAVGQRLREARHAAGLTQRELSFEGCTAAYVSRIEAGARVPSLQILREFGKRLGVSADFLATGSPAGKDLSSELLEAEVALRLGDEQRAAELYEATRNNSDSPAALAQAQLGLGRLAAGRGDVPEAIGLLEEALGSGELLPGDASSAANALGRIYAAQSRFDEAFALFERFLAEARKRGDKFEQVRFALLLANAYVDHGDYGRAHATLGEVLDLARQTVDPMLRAALYWSQSRVHLEQGEPDRAAEYAQLAIATLKASEQTLAAAGALLMLAYIENDRGNPEVALELVDEGEPIVATAGDDRDAAMFTVERARALSALGESEEAVALLLGVVPRLNAAAPRDAARSYSAVADVFRREGDIARALELYELAAERAPAPSRHRAEALTAMAEIYEERGDAQMALDLLKQALAARAGSTV